MGAGWLLGAIELLGEGAVENVVDEGGEFLLDLRNFVEQLQGFGRRKIQDVGNGMAFEAHG